MIVFSFLRSLIMTLLFPLTVLILGPAAIVCHFIFANHKIDSFFIRFWGQLVCKMYGVSVKAEGIENVGLEGGIILFNHSSFFDIFALVVAIPGIRFGAKAELFKLPIFGQALKILGNLKITRDNREEVFRIYDEAKERFSKNEKFCLAPEGGRFYDPKSLGRFKSGPFIFAISSGAHLIPVMIFGAHEVWPKGSLFANWDQWHRVIHVRIFAPQPTQHYSLNERQELQKKIYELMNQAWSAQNNN